MFGADSYFICHFLVKFMVVSSIGQIRSKAKELEEEARTRPRGYNV